MDFDKALLGTGHITCHLPASNPRRCMVPKTTLPLSPLCWWVGTTSPPRDAPTGTQFCCIPIPEAARRWPHPNVVEADEPTKDGERPRHPPLHWDRQEVVMLNALNTLFPATAHAEEPEWVSGALDLVQTQPLLL